MHDVLRDIRVVDLSRYIAGPLCAAHLADYGADVIRVERPGGGDDRFLYPSTSGGDGALFLQMNRNKRGITLDATAEGGGEVLRRLIETADVVITSVPPSVQRAQGLDYESLRAIRSDIILTSVTAFGPDGPYAERVGFDGVGQAMSGAVWMSGEPGHPTKSFAAWVDFTTGLMALQATMAAIMARQQTGEGREVEANLIASALSVMNFPLIEQALTGVDRQPTGNRGHSGAPADIFRTRDGWIAVQVIGNSLFRRWAKMVGQEDWVGDPRFVSDDSRAAHAELLSARMTRWTAERRTADALAALGQARIPAGPVLDARAALSDPHVRDAGPFVEMEYPGAVAPVPVATAMGRPGVAAPLRRRAPLAGEHNDEVLAALGYGRDAIAALCRSGAITSDA